jgi:hypothetical protein
MTPRHPRTAVPAASPGSRGCQGSRRLNGGELQVVSLTAGLQDVLAGIDDETIDEAAARWAAPDEYYGTGADTELAAGALRDLVRLVRAGRERGEALYCWVCF